MNPLTDPTTTVGLPVEKIMRLSDTARTLYDLMYDYCTYSSDPQYKTLHKFRNKINTFQGTDRDLLIEYFNNDPAIKWSGIPSVPFEYYSKPY